MLKLIAKEIQIYRRALLSRSAGLREINILLSLLIECFHIDFVLCVFLTK